MTLLGIIGAASWGTERIIEIKPEKSVSLSGYTLTYEGLKKEQGPNYTAEVGTFTVREGGNVIGVMQPSKRNFAARQMSTNEAALMMRGGGGQLYLVARR